MTPFSYNKDPSIKYKVKPVALSNPKAICGLQCFYCTVGTFRPNCHRDTGQLTLEQHIFRNSKILTVRFSYATAGKQLV